MDDHMSSHPAARLFPLIKGDEFEALVDDIRENGQREPILLHPDGSILDGRNRYLACRKLGIEPKSEHWDGEGSPEEIVLSLNLHRRHLSSAQRAAIAVEILPKLEAEAKELQRLSQGRGKKGLKFSSDLLGSEQTTENKEVNDDSKREQKAKRTKGEDVAERSIDRAAKMFATANETSHIIIRISGSCLWVVERIRPLCQLSMVDLEGFEPAPCHGGNPGMPKNRSHA